MTAPRLSRALLADAAWRARATVPLPASHLLDLPERVVQFGTGAFLRGFVDAFIDSANAAGTFGGRIVAVGSTGSGRDRAFHAQDGLYTLVARGIERGVMHEERRVIASVSRALSAETEWDAVLACARSPGLALVISNTTEVGITFDASDRFDASPPTSFPGKLTRFLYERARATDFADTAGLIVVPCELIVRNGDELRSVVQRLATHWGLGAPFTAWLHSAVTFCNTLVDRIVPGAPSGADRELLRDSLGYDDDLLTTAESFRQFVIEGDAQLEARLGFVSADPGIIVTDDIAPYRERKVRLLNGAHSIGVAPALLAGCTTVHDAMQHPTVGPFLRHTLLHDIVPTLDVPHAGPFAHDVLQRFGNPFIRHALLDITLQGTTKWRVRLVPTILQAVQQRGAVPPSLAFGLAAHLAFLRGDLQRGRAHAGHAVPPDDRGATIAARWTALEPSPDAAALHVLVHAVLADTTLWDTDLTMLPGFVEAVTTHLARITSLGMDRALVAVLEAPTT